MKERPILFSAPMVRALLAGTKTQTRRAVRPQPVDADRIIQFGYGFAVGRMRDSENAWRPIRCPYGVPGDRLWVKETHAFSAVDPEGLDWRDDPENWDVIYRADAQQPSGGWRNADGKVIAAPWRPSIFMPRRASRITLEVTDVHVERPQDISEADAVAEGIGEFILTDDAPQQAGSTPQEGYRYLWERINGAGSWDANPWVWVVQFRRLPKP